MKKNKTGKSKFPKFKFSLNRKNLKYGSYAVMVTAILLAVLVVVNLVFSQIPTKYTQIDLTSTKLYTLSDETIEYLSGVDQDVTLYWIVQEGNEDETIGKLLDHFSEENDHIKVVSKDPVLYPQFTSQYTDDSVDENSVIVVAGERSKIVDYSDIYESSFDYTTYQETTTGFDGEGQIASAISYCLSEDAAVVYSITGHNEIEIPSSIQNSIEKAGVTLEETSLMASEAVPDDASAIIINAPSKDFSENEAQAVIDYLENGGKALIVYGYSGSEMPNFENILDSYGITVSQGIIMENDANHTLSSQQPYYLLPTIEDAAITTDLTDGNTFVLLPAAMGLSEKEGHRDTLTVESLLTTSESSFLKTDVENMTTYQKEDSDVDGPFSVGMEVTESTDNGETQLAVVSSAYLMDDSTNTYVSGGNASLVVSAIQWMCGTTESSISIPAKDLSETSLTVTGAQGGFWSVTAMVIFPVLCLVIGGVIWLRRRKR